VILSIWTGEVGRAKDEDEANPIFKDLTPITSLRKQTEVISPHAAQKSR
jgi:hypothetical protein